MKYLICKYDELSTRHFHISHMLDQLVEKFNEDYTFVELDAIGSNCDNQEKLINYFNQTFGNIPTCIISFSGVGSFNKYYKIICKVTKLIFIVDDIHHGKSIRNPRIPVISNSHMIFATYAYQFTKWGLPCPKTLHFFPHSARWLCDYNPDPINKILISGRISDIYPDREYAADKALENPNLFDILKCNINYRSSGEGICGKNFYDYLNKYICCFVDTARDYILAKIFEICASGSLLLCADTNIIHIMKQIGFENNINYISCSRDNFMDRVNWILHENNREQVDIIRTNGHELIKNQHMWNNRMDFFHMQISNNSK